MLRITQREECLMVEGRIAGPWVRELRRAAEECLARHLSPALDLSGVSYVDAEGASLLRSLVAQRMPIRSSSAFVRAMLKETSR
jgi:ABC-type transporter Mla MlaB component